MRPPKGYVEQYDTVVIPKELKDPILDYLRTGHDLTASTVYNDIHGFMRFHKVHESAYAEYYAGVVCENRGEYEKAIDRYSKSIRLNLNPFEAYVHFQAHNNRGNVYRRLGEYSRAIQDYDMAIKINDRYADAYANRGATYWEMDEFEGALSDYSAALGMSGLNDIGITCFKRGMSWLRLKAWEKASSDLSSAQAHGIDIVFSFSSNFVNVAAFERKHNVQLPPDIVALLSSQ